MLVTVGRRRVPADMSARLPPVMPDADVRLHVDLSFGQAARPVQHVLQRTAAPAVRTPAPDVLFTYRRWLVSQNVSWLS